MFSHVLLFCIHRKYFWILFLSTGLFIYCFAAIILTLETFWTTLTSDRPRTLSLFDHFIILGAILQYVFVHLNFRFGIQFQEQTKKSRNKNM